MYSSQSRSREYLGRHRAPSRSAVPHSDRSLGQRVGRGVAWSAINAAVLRLSQFLVGIIVARLVSPNEFGVFVVALTIYTIIVNISELSVGSAIVREVGRTREIAPTVSTIAIGTSGLLTIVMVASAPWLADLLGAPAATSAIRILALTVVIGGLGMLPAAILTRDYQQKQRFAADATLFVVSSIVLVVMAALGMGVMALAWSRVAGMAASTVMLNVVEKERYWPHFNPHEARRLLRFSLPLAGANLISMFIGNVDFMVIGRLRGAVRLGYYNLAYNVSSWPVSIFSAILVNVTLTTLSRVRDSKAELERHLAAAMSALAATSFPLSALSISLATPLVTVVYGARWSPAATALMLLSVFGAARVIIALLSDLLVALGMTRGLLLLQVLWLGALVPAMVIGVRLWGIAGAGLAHAAVALVVVVPAYLLVIVRRSRVGVGWLITSTWMPLLASSACGIAAWAAARLPSSALLACAYGVVAGGATYLVLLGPWLRRLVRQLRSLYGEGAVSLDDSRTQVIAPVLAPDAGAHATREPVNLARAAGSL